MSFSALSSAIVAFCPAQRLGFERVLAAGRPLLVTKSPWRIDASRPHCNLFRFVQAAQEESCAALTDKSKFKSQFQLDINSSGIDIGPDGSEPFTVDDLRHRGGPSL
ncbi:hypothetical protein ACVWXM_009525 [Bradyrhizobium sp. GM7.3]